MIQCLVQPHSWSALWYHVILEVFHSLSSPVLNISSPITIGVICAKPTNTKSLNCLFWKFPQEPSSNIHFIPPLNTTSYSHDVWFWRSHRSKLSLSYMIFDRCEVSFLDKLSRSIEISTHQENWKCLSWITTLISLNKHRAERDSSHTKIFHVNQKGFQDVKNSKIGAWQRKKKVRLTFMETYKIGKAN